MLDFSKIKTYPINERSNKFHLKENMISIDNDIHHSDEKIEKLAKKIINAKEIGSKTIVMLGGAVIKEGCGILLIDLMKKGYINHIAGNGAVSIHDFEIALIGETSEEVTNGLEEGIFGMVEETGRYMNEALNDGVKENLGYGYSIAKKIDEMDLKYKDYSVLYNAYKLGIPVTIHVAIGGDIIHQHPFCNGASLGASSFRDFEIITGTISKLQNGALLNIGSAVNMPEVFLKALTIARNLGYDVRNFASANFDFIDMYRPRTRIIEWPKVIGCEGFDIRGHHRKTVSALYRYINKK